MKYTALILTLAAITAAASAQTPANPATTPAKPATAKAATATKPAVKSAPTHAKPVTPAEKLPAGVAAIKAPVKTLYTISVRYQDEKVGDGAEAEAGKLLKFNYTVWTAGADGLKFDSSYDHPGQPLKDKDGKPVLGEDGKPKLSDPQPMQVTAGQGRPLPGWDMGAEGMKVGGKRRIFIPWQLGFGAHEIPARPGRNPEIPGKSDLIVDLELADVADAPTPPQRPMMGPGMHPPMGGHPMSGAPGAPPAPGAVPAPAKPAAPAAAPAPATAPKPAPPAAPAAAPAPAAPATPAQPQSK